MEKRFTHKTFTDLDAKNRKIHITAFKNDSHIITTDEFYFLLKESPYFCIYLKNFLKKKYSMKKNRKIIDMYFPTVINDGKYFKYTDYAYIIMVVTEKNMNKNISPFIKIINDEHDLEIIKYFQTFASDTINRIMQQNSAYIKFENNTDIEIVDGIELNNFLQLHEIDDYETFGNYVQKCIERQFSEGNNFIEHDEEEKNMNSNTISQIYGNMCKSVNILRYFYMYNLTFVLTLADYTIVDGLKIPLLITLHFKFGQTKIIFRYDQPITCGSFGCVFSYSGKYANIQHQDNTYNIVLKTGDIATDIAIYKEIGRGSCIYALVSAYDIDNYQIMDKMEGTIDKYINNFKFGNNTFDIALRTALAIQIVNKVAKNINCLKQNGYYYTDIKYGNILYECTDANKYIVCLGDFGSIAHVKNIKTSVRATYTYAPPDFDGKVSERLIMWGLGTLFLDLAGVDKGAKWKYISNLKMEQDALIKKVHSSIKLLITNLIDVITHLFNPSVADIEKDRIIGNNIIKLVSKDAKDSINLINFITSINKRNFDELITLLLNRRNLNVQNKQNKQKYYNAKEDYSKLSHTSSFIDDTEIDTTKVKSTIRAANTQ